jgi:hypothetical protein
MASFLEVAVVVAVVVPADGRFIDTALSILSIPFLIASPRIGILLASVFNGALSPVIVLLNIVTAPRPCA